jgi:hypothetical protein
MRLGRVETVPNSDMRCNIARLMHHEALALKADACQ